MQQLIFENQNISSLLAAICVVIALVYLLSQLGRQRKGKLPPGPMGLPIVGYLPFMTNMPHLKMAELASKYGNVFSLRLGSTFVVVLNGAKAIREAFSKPEFLARPPSTVFNVVENFESPFFSSGKAWQEQRRFALHVMRDLGLGKSRMEKHILDEIEYVLEIIKESDAMPINIKEKLTPSTSNNICSLVFGSRYQYDNPERMFLDKTLETVTRSLRQLSPFVFFPWLRRLPFSRIIFKNDTFKKMFEELRKFMKKHIDTHEKTLDPNDIRDYMDGYLIEMKNRLEKDGETTFSHNMLIGSAVNFFGAGSESVRTSVDWCLYTMAAFPDVQKQVQSEIDEIIGREKMPSWVDHKEMPFTQSLLMEMHRWKTISPVSLMRYCLADTEVQGYHIPKGATVLPNLWSAHHDPDEWDQPSEFRPKRFLSADGKTIIKSDSYMPFSTGKRSCPGEILALVEVFLYFTSILQRFTVEMPENAVVRFEAELGITYHLKPHLLCFKRRP